MNHPLYILQIAVLLSFISYSTGISQVNEFALRREHTAFNTVSERGVVTFNEKNKVLMSNVFESYHSAFGLDDRSVMKPGKISTDQYGNQHIKYHQFYDGIPIYGAEYMIHGKNDVAMSGNGKIYTPNHPDSEILLTPEKALEKALNYIHATKYYWEDSGKEAKAKQINKNGLTSYYPQAEKVYLMDAASYQMQLTFAFSIYTFDKGKSGKYFVDATDGNILKFNPADLDCDPTTIQSNWYGNKNINTHNIGGSFDLENNCNSSIYGVYDYMNGNTIFNSPDNTWVSDWARSAATSLWAIKRSYVDYFNKFGIHGHDNNDGNLDVYQGYDFGGNDPNNNASYHYDFIGDDEINIGIGDTNAPTDDWNTIDIVGHEFTHGVTNYTAALEYEGQSGALNESFSDIFGEWIESIELGNPDWFQGQARVNANGCHLPGRYFVDPAKTNVYVGGCTRNFNQPNTYGGTNWIQTTGCDPTGDNDQCGVHTNSGVQNQMFYLLVVGGSGFNSGTTCHDSLGNGYLWSLEGIGLEHAIEIAFQTLSFYLGSTSDYQDARDAWVHAANTLFGECSPEAIATGKAWYAVGFDPPSIVNTVLCNQTYGNIPETVEAPGALITDSNCTVTITNGGGKVYFKAGNYVKLNPGFHAVQASKFEAVLTDCEFAVY